MAKRPGPKHPPRGKRSAPPAGPAPAGEGWSPAWLTVAPPTGRSRGRPRLIESPEEFLERMDAYLDACARTAEPITMTGMALALGFYSRQSLFAYGKDPRFSLPVKLARCIVEHDYEVGARKHGRAGDIFGLKNFGWIDEHTMRLTGEDGGPVRFRDMTDAELVERGRQVANRLLALEEAHAGGNGSKPGGGNGTKPGRNGDGGDG